MLDTTINREVAVFGVVWIDAPVDRYLERYRDIEQFEAAASLQIKKLAHPPALSDFTELTLEENDLRVGIRHGDNNLQGFEVVKRCLHWLR